MSHWGIIAMAISVIVFGVTMWIVFGSPPEGADSVAINMALTALVLAAVADVHSEVSDDG